MRIDSHVHVWTLGAPPYTHNDDMSTQRPESPGLVENLIRYMDLNQIDRTVLIQCMYHGYDNSYLCDCLQRFPDRLHGVAAGSSQTQRGWKTRASVSRAWSAGHAVVSDQG